MILCRASLRALLKFVLMVDPRRQTAAGRGGESGVKRGVVAPSCVYTLVSNLLTAAQTILV